jgi:hypothetical protein
MLLLHLCIFLFFYVYLFVFQYYINNILFIFDIFTPFFNLKLKKLQKRFAHFFRSVCHTVVDKCALYAG